MTRLNPPHHLQNDHVILHGTNRLFLFHLNHGCQRIRWEALWSDHGYALVSLAGDDGVFSLPAVLQRPKRKKLPDPEPSHATKLRRQALVRQLCGGGHICDVTHLSTNSADLGIMSCMNDPSLLP